MCWPDSVWEKQFIDGEPTFLLGLALLPLLQFFRMIVVKLLWEWAQNRYALNRETSMLDRCGFRGECRVTAGTMDLWSLMNPVEVLPTCLLASHAVALRFETLTSDEEYHAGSDCCIAGTQSLAGYVLSTGMGRILSRDRPRGDRGWPSFSRPFSAVCSTLRRFRFDYSSQNYSCSAASSEHAYDLR